MFESSNQDTGIHVTVPDTFKIYNFKGTDKNILDLSEIVSDLNKRSFDHHCMRLMCEKNVEDYKKIICELPLFILGKEYNKTHNAIFPVVFKLESF